MDELIQEYFETKKLLEKYKKQLESARDDSKIPNVHYLDNLEDRSAILGLEFQIDRLSKRLEEIKAIAMEEINAIAKENSITSEESHKTK